MLMCQLLIYRRILRQSRRSTEAVTLSTFDFDRRDVAALQRSGGIADALLDESFDVALQYTNEILVGD